jgi:glucose 1-dehydrogenase
MRAMTVIPGKEDSAELTELPAPTPAEGELLVEPLYLGVCGTDREIVEGAHGEPPPGRERLVLGHELLGRVRDTGQLVAGIVRRPDPVPCACCARGEWDMCRNGQYTERGIKALDGYGAELVTLEADFAVAIPDELGTLGVLTEPASVLAKAWEQIERISSRACSEHDRALVTGAGPIGLLAALMGAQRGLEVHVLDRSTEGPKPEAVQALGARYHVGDVTEVAKEVEPDVVVECTGVAELVAGAMQHTAPGAIVCLTGVAPSRTLSVDVGALNNELVLENDVVFGSVNANRRHFDQAVQSLREADADWLRRLITRTVPLDHWQEALEKHDDDIKVVVDFAQR